MKKLLFIFTVLLFVSCGETSHEEKETQKKMDNEYPVSTPVEASEYADLDYYNPAFMAGSDFGNFFQKMYDLGDYDMMLDFTSDESIERHGEEKIIDYYKNMEFGYDLGVLKKAVNDKDEISTLYYKANINATQVRVVMKVVVENDSCKLYLGSNVEDAIIVNKEL